MAATARHEAELKKKALEEVKKARDPIDKIRWQCLSRGAAGIRDLGRVFRNFDDSGDQQLDYKEFCKGVRDIGLTLGKQDLEAAFKAIDKDGSGSLNFDEFLVKIRGNTLNKKRIVLVEKAFKKLDQNDNGTIEIDDLKGVYDVTQDDRYKTGEMGEDELLREFLDKFDSPDNRDGTVTKEEFISYYAGISASVDNDAYFDLMMRRAWRLDEPNRPKTGGAFKPNIGYQTPEPNGYTLTLPSLSGNGHGANQRDFKVRGLRGLKPRSNAKGHLLTTQLPLS
ncbi:calcyphosin-like protein [Symsagittifera roscoffensis]|uniref:calcyphosin-like protein n=1 Tax=Symsagittifera roscoffensis TaxID=84072 RepID=UPI00307BB316